MAFRVEFLQECDERLVQLCLDYWAVDERGDFVYSVTTLAQTYGYTAHRVARLVPRVSRAYDPQYVCENCGRPLYHFYSRTAYLNLRGQLTGRQCETCRRAQSPRRLTVQVEGPPDAVAGFCRWLRRQGYGGASTSCSPTQPEAACVQLSIVW